MYDLDKDPLEWTNLAGKPELYEIEKRLRAQLDAWMAEQGDGGQAAELAAREHQGGRRNKRSK